VAEESKTVRRGAKLNSSGRAVGGRLGADRARSPRREQEVLDAAVKVFSGKGYADASVQDIADELGILKGSLYHYMNSKEDLLFRLLEETHAEVQAILEEVVALEHVDPVRRLCAYFTRQAVYLTKNVAKMSIYYHDLDKLSDERRRGLIRKRRVHERFVVEMIQAGQARGDVAADVNPSLTMNYLFGSMIWMYRWYAPAGKIKAPADPPELRGVRHPQPRSCPQLSQPAAPGSLLDSRREHYRPALYSAVNRRGPIHVCPARTARTATMSSRMLATRGASTLSDLNSSPIRATNGMEIRCSYESASKSSRWTSSFGVRPRTNVSGSRR
jgi:TetR/AcrR family transcriptional regulator, cholesterol catabolism regulator